MIKGLERFDDTDDIDGHELHPNDFRMTSSTSSPASELNSHYSHRKEVEDPWVTFNENLAKRLAAKEGLSVKELQEKEKKLSTSMNTVGFFKNVSSIEEIPKRHQKMMRAQLNAQRAPENKITYADINPDGPSFDKKKAKLIVLAYNNYVATLNESSVMESTLKDELDKVKEYPQSKLKKKFASIPSNVKSEIMQDIGLQHNKISDYTTENKQKIVALFNLNY
ncbi:MAG: hypothetical protein WC875_04395 [Candidatus Absconditabacterales bacterium]